MDYRIICDVFNKQLIIKGENLQNIIIAIKDGEIDRTPAILSGDSEAVVLDASGLDVWTSEKPKIYDLSIKDADKEEKIKFGFRNLTTHGNSILLNSKPYYFRGYIRGIVAHDHPNLTGLDDVEAYRKNIMQAKKYGFNLVRFHSTVPDEKFVDIADELGLFVHLEIGFSYRFNEKGEKSEKFLDKDKWIETLKKFRNHPSVMTVCIGNEMHNSGKDLMVKEFYEIGKELAPNILILDNTGWGEYDRESTDFYAQHIAYYFPYKKHKDMFKQDFYWEKNGSVKDLEIYSNKDCEFGKAQVRRHLNPSRTYIAHEIVHYIDIPDYEKLGSKFDEFAVKSGDDYLKKNNIKKPRYLTEIPDLLKSKKLNYKLPEYIKASQAFKKTCLKVYLEELRAAENICGFEMLQLSDCFKYENKNGILDFFDDDKYIDPGWMRQINSDDVLLADLPECVFFKGSSVTIPLSLSHYSPECINNAKLDISLTYDNNTEEIYSGSGYSVLRNGVVKLSDIMIEFSKINYSGILTLKAYLKYWNEKGDEKIISNEWKLWIYERPQFDEVPQLRLNNKVLKDFITSNSGSGKEDSVILADILDDQTIANLAEGKTVVLVYDGCKALNEKDQYYLPGVFERFKPCIWDRGHNLGGIIHENIFADKLGGNYFDLNMYYAVEEGYKINLDGFPVKVKDIISGVDKPVRDRMKGLIEKIKDFLPQQTLRNFSYLFSVKVGEGNLIVCTFNFSNPEYPVCAAILDVLVNKYENLLPGDSDKISIEELRKYLEECTRKGEEKEDVMNLYWAEDNRPVEDQLFWEKAGVDLSKLKS